MKRVALIGADFAPSSLPPALRLRFFVSHLREFGWEPTVISTDSHHYDCALDPEIERLLPEGVRVIRTPALPRNLTRLVGLGDLGARSMGYHWRVLRDLCRRGEVDLVFISVPAYMPMVLGRMAHSRFGIPYVIDYIDPWGSDYYWTVPRSERPPKWIAAYTTARLLERYALRRVAHVVGVSRGTTDLVRQRYPWLGEADTTEIPYGGETGDWEYIRRHPRSNQVFDPADGLRHFCSVGAYTEAMRPVLRTFFAGVRKARAEGPELAGVRLHFVGTSYSTGRPCVAPIAREEGVEDLVDEHPHRVPYLDALQLLSDAHALLVIGSAEPHYTASKIFPYILARKPLLTIFHRDSSVIGIVERAQAGSVVRFSAEHPLQEKTGEVAQSLRELAALDQGYEPRTRWQAFEAYTTRAMTARLAEVFDKVLARHSPAESEGTSLAYSVEARR
jgi:hypothetical protein